MIKNSHLKPEMTKIEKKMNKCMTKDCYNYRYFYPTIAIVTLNMNDLNTPFRRQRNLGWV